MLIAEQHEPVVSRSRETTGYMVADQHHAGRATKARRSMTDKIGDKGKKNAELRSLISSDKAEAETGISQQQVSRWRTRQAAKLLGVPEWTVRDDMRGNLAKGARKSRTGSAATKAAKLIKGGVSQRQAAKLLGVSYTTIQKDVTTKLSKSDNKSVTGSAATKAKRAKVREQPTSVKQKRTARPDFQIMRCCMI